MSLRTMLRRLLRERRWIPDSETRAAHDATVRARLDDGRRQPDADEERPPTPPAPESA
jgi:hypothetical protein